MQLDLFAALLPTVTCFFGAAWEVDCTSRQPCAKCEAFQGD